MALRIVKAADPITVEQIITVIYAAPGIGKTSLAFTAEKPLNLDFDKGVHRSGNRGDSVPVSSWADVVNISRDDLKPYKTLVMDTAGRALDVLSLDIITQDPKNGRGGSLTLQGYGVLKGRFTNYLTLIRSFGLDVVLLVHMDEQRKGDELIERLDVQGGSKNEIYKSADLMGRLRVKRGGGWELDFSPTDTAFGKNPAGFPVLTVPDFGQEPQFLARVIADTKKALNKQSAEQEQTAKALADWQDRIEQAGSPKQLNDLIPLISEESDASVRDNAKRLLVKHGTAKGFVFDRDLPGFKMPAHVAKSADPAVDENGWPVDSALAAATA